jgi:hydroxymethylbilane synthase
MLTTGDPDLVVRLVEVDTTGDQDRLGSITSLSESGAFVRGVQQLVLEEQADLAVHSLKDLPVTGPDGLVMAAIPERASPFDVLVGSTVAELPESASVGTGSPRRSAQLLEMRPDLQPTEIRGNVGTRVRKVESGEFHAAVLAEAGLERLGLGDRASQRFGAAQMVPAPGQGALAVEARRGSVGEEAGSRIDDAKLRPLVEAERRLLAETGAGCRSALGALATWDGDQIRLEVFISDERGPRRGVVHGSAAEEVVTRARQEIGL